MRNIIRTSALICLVVPAFIISKPAHAGLLSDSEARKSILELSQRLDASLASQQEERNQIEQLQQEVAKLRGQNESMQHNLVEIKQAQTEGYTSIDERIRKFEPQTVTVAGVQGIVKPEEQQNYDAALKLFNDGSYPAAQKAMRAFASSHPKSVYIPYADFYQGTAAYANRNYKTAAALLQNILKKYPNFERISDTMLNLANTYIEMNQKTEAQKLLHDIVEKYPNSDNSKAAQELLNPVIK